MKQAWPLVPLGEVLRKSDERVALRPDQEYREVTVRLWGKGVVERRRALGSEIAASERAVVRQDQFILSRIDARNGASGLVPESLDGAVVSGDFPAFSLISERILPAFMGWLGKTQGFIDICKHASEGTTNRVRLKEERLLATEIPLPRLPEQRRIVARIEALAAKIEEARALRAGAEKSIAHMLASAFHQIAEDAPVRPLSEVAPLTRRPIPIQHDESYPQIAVRSFGRGTFHKPPLPGSEVSWQKLFLVKTGDILISNIKAWEGALAVADNADDGRAGSHRYLTCVPVDQLATARFVCFYLLTPEGLSEVGDASPGSADRNRTLSTKKLQEIRVPVPSYGKQLHFDRLLQEVDALKQLQAETAAELDALLPAILDKAFKGEL